MSVPDEIDEALNRRMELTQFKPGDVLTTENCAEIMKLFDEFEEETRRAADSYDEGLQAGRTEAAGADLAALLKMVDGLKADLIIERSLRRFLDLVREQDLAAGQERSAS
jgi:hypothetical protein